MKYVLYILLLSQLFACTVSKYTQFEHTYHFSAASGSPDYSSLDYWAAHPWKHDPSDSVPKMLKPSYHSPDSTVDIFFIHPTTYTSDKKEFGWNASIDDPALTAKTDYTSILYQASVFNEAGRIFAPRYRQAHLSSYFPKTAEDTIQAVAAFEEAYDDVKQAFEYYLAHWNKGRPIIIASHSQGTTHAKRLIKEFFDGKPLQQQLVAAYLVGMAVEPDWFTALPPCTTPSQTGCVCSWRTFQEGYKPDYVEKEKFTAVVTNPLTWDAAQPYAPADMNKGAILRNFDVLKKDVVDAKVEKGVLWTMKPHFTGSFLLHTKNFHIADYNFFYLSIRQNAQERTEAFKNKAR